MNGDSTGHTAPQPLPFQLYDTTLRDGIQQEGLNVTVDDKLAIAPLLDELGVTFIEGGWPGAIPKDTEFFRRAADGLRLRHATLAAFGATRRAGLAVEDDPQVGGLLDSKAPVVTLVAKAHPGHVTRALRTTLEENLAMVADTVGYLVEAGRRVFVDAEHFFDGYLADADYARAVVAAAHGAGAEAVVLCDTNGGMLPAAVARVVTELAGSVPGVLLGMHAHNDSGCAVANSLAAVGAGARHVQGTVNGYGERTGNADLLTVAADLQLKTDLGVRLAGLAEATRICHTVSALTNVPPYARQPYVGASAFAHKAGLHASAIRVDPDLYQHVDPVAVGNDMRMLVSDMAGRASIELKGRELGFDLAGQAELLGRVTGRVKDLEAQGYTFDEADASFELLLREEHDGARPEYFAVESWRAITESHPAAGREAESEATVKLRVGERRCVATGEGNGPVNALDAALRAALADSYPQITAFDLIDYRVRILDAEHGTDAIIRVVIKTTDGVRTWTTVGVGTNIIDASWQALTDAFVYGLLHEAGA